MNEAISDTNAQYSITTPTTDKQLSIKHVCFNCQETTKRANLLALSTVMGSNMYLQSYREAPTFDYRNPCYSSTQALNARVCIAYSSTGRIHLSAFTTNTYTDSISLGERFSNFPVF